MLIRKKAAVSASVAGNESGIDPGYYAQGQTWEKSVYRSAIASRRLAWTVAGTTSAISLLLAGALFMLIPLQKYEPYLIIQDKTTGYLEIARTLQPGGLADDAAVTQANIVRYLRARETYDYNGLGRDYQLALLLSTGQAARDYETLYSEANPQAPHKLLGRTTRINVNVKSVSLLNERTAQVRFSTIRLDDQQQTESHYVSTIRFRYSSVPMRNELRFDNPLGFQVTEYRRDQESVNEATRTINP